MTVSTSPSSNRAWVLIDLGNLVENARAVKRAARDAALLPVVKADAYGLGAVPVARALERLDPWGFAVATVNEALELRQAGIRRPILVLTPANAALESAYVAHGLRAVLDDPTLAARWTEPYHLEIDTGMSRCGVRWDDERLSRFRGALEGAFTHFHSADEHPETVAPQWERFEKALDRLGKRPTLLHAANSAGAFRLDRRLDLVRPGVFLYGGSAGTGLPAPKPVATVRAPVVGLRRVKKGDTVSYGATWRAAADTTIATLAIGYADGVPRAVECRASVLLGGGRRPMVGRVTMDFIMVDLGPHGGATLGDVAVIVGRDRGDEITIDEFASWSGTISYEALTRLGLRMEREYLGS